MRVNWRLPFSLATTWTIDCFVFVILSYFVILLFIRCWRFVTPNIFCFILFSMRRRQISRDMKEYFIVKDTFTCFDILSARNTI